MKAYTFLITLSISFVANAAVEMQDNIATPDNLSTFQLIPPKLTEQDKLDVELNNKLEQDMALQQLIYDSSPQLPQMALGTNETPFVTAELFQNAPSVGKQFLLVRERGRIRYVFATSAAAAGRSTPRGTFGVTKQLWRHMSSSYPSGGENNMDHVTYFKPLYGFHSTTFGAYSDLGNRASHGCVRLGRPQARAVFTLIRANGSRAGIYSYGLQDPPAEELRLIKKLLAEDLNFIQDMIRSKNRGDVPFKESAYYDYLSGDMSRATIKEAMRRAGITKILDVDDGQGRIPHNSPASLMR